MNQVEIGRIKRFAGVMKELYSKAPDYKVASVVLLQMMELSELSLVLQQKRQQDWEAIASSLLDSHYFANLYKRCEKIVEAVRRNPGSDYQHLATVADYDKVTIRQTVNALSQGGFKLDTLTAETKNGRPRKLIHLGKQ